MSAEHLHESSERSEHESKNHEHLEHERERKLDELAHRPERVSENQETRAEAAREVILQQEQAPKPPKAPEAAPPPPNPHLLNHKLNHAETMMAVQRRLSPLSRRFSRVIHAPVIEKTSEALEKTLARPSITAGATWTALIVGSIFYLTARHYGYSLSGAEILFSFVVGAFMGLALEGLWRTLTQRR